MESFSPTINIMNRTTSESLYKKKDMASTSKTTYKNLKKLNKTQKKINYSNSTREINNKKNFRDSHKKIIKYEKPNSINYINNPLENEKVSLKIFNDLDKIQEALLEDFKIIVPLNEPKENNKEQNNGKKINNNKLNSNINSDNKYLTVPIKSKTSENFFPINHSIDKTSVPLNKLNNTHSHKRLKTSEDKKPQHITRYLDRKKINDLPVTYPLYLSYNNKYNSISEKNRVDKILGKLICLKTHLLKDPLNRIEIIKEFFLKHGFDKDIYYKDYSISNFYYYLKQPFSFPPEYSLQDVINEGIKYNYNKGKDEKYDAEINNFLDYLPKNRKWSDYTQYNSKKKTKNSPSERAIIYNLLMEEIFKKRYINYDSFKQKTLPVLIKDLENELREIKREKMDKLEKYNSVIATRKLRTFKLKDNNKYVPNLCLISKGFKEKCKAVIDKKNKKIIKNMNKQEHLKQINNRLYYDNIRKNSLIEFDINYIQRRLKLTEYVFMEMAKKKLQYLNAKNKFKSSLERIGKKE